MRGIIRLRYFLLESVNKKHFIEYIILNSIISIIYDAQSAFTFILCVIISLLQVCSMEFVMRSDERLPARQNKNREYKHYPCNGHDGCCSVEENISPRPWLHGYMIL